jgi:hypothetical protein
VTLQRTWGDGDRIDIRLPMKLHLEELPGDPDTVALLYGPVVLAGKMGTEEMPDPYVRSQTDLSGVPSPEAPVLLVEKKALLDQVKPVSGQTMKFQTKGIGWPREVTFIPFYQLHHERYSVYWKISDKKGWAVKQAQWAANELQRKELEARLVDRVRVGEEQSERDHDLQGEDTQSGIHSGRLYRQARGWFSYVLKISESRDHVLHCTYGGDDVGRVFEILVEGQLIATEKLERNRPGEFFDIYYRLPRELIEGRKELVVQFRALPDSLAGGVFGCAVLKVPGAEKGSSH